MNSVVRSMAMEVAVEYRRNATVECYNDNNLLEIMRQYFHKEKLLFIFAAMKRKLI